MTETLTFSSKIRAWCDKTKERQLAVFRLATLNVFDEATTPVTKGGLLPYKTGFLHDSFIATVGEPAFVTRDRPAGYVGSADNSAIQLVVANASAEDRISGVFTAAYAMRQEYGFSGEDSLGRHYEQGGKGFVRAACQRWQTLVNEAVAQVKQELP